MTQVHENDTVGGTRVCCWLTGTNDHAIVKGSADGPTVQIIIVKVVAVEQESQ